MSDSPFITRPIMVAEHWGKMKLNELKVKQHKSERTTLQQVQQWCYELIPFLNKAADDAANVAGRTCNALTSVPSVGVYSEDYIVIQSEVWYDSLIIILNPVL